MYNEVYYKDSLQKDIIEYGIEYTVKKYLYNQNNITKSRKNDLSKIALENLNYDIKRYIKNMEKTENENFEKILTELLKISKNNYFILENHDVMLNLCIKKDKKKLIDFILSARNYFDGILMLLNSVNILIKQKIIDIQLLVKYLNKLKEYNIEYLDEIKDKVSPYVFSQILLY
jgi:hypothetical protein